MDLSSSSAAIPESGFAREHRELVRRTLQAMIVARTLESKLSSLYKAGKIVGGVYLGTGQEAFSGAIGCCLEQDRDIFAPLIRDQAGRAGFGEPLLEATQTYLGSALGPMRGRDGNVHRGRPGQRRPAMISHLGTSLSMVAGMLMARRLKGELAGVVGATCLGEGATSTGSFHEGLNLVAVERLPLVVMVADNQFAYSTPRERQFACESLVDRAKGYGLRGVEVDGTDFLRCLEVVHGAVEAARQGDGPQLVVGKMLRLCGHGEHDDASYVPEEVRASGLGRDCLEVGVAQVTSAGLAEASEVERWKSEATEEVQAAVAKAQTEPGPDPYREEWRAVTTPGMQQ